MTPRSQDSITFGRMLDPGDHASVRDVYDACHRRLVARLYDVTGDLDAAEDAVREAFVLAVASGSRFWRAGDREAWLRAAAIRAHRTRRWRRSGVPTLPRRAPWSGHTPYAPPSETTPEPDELDLIEAAGDARRRRRRAAAATVAAAVLGIAAVLTEGQPQPPGPGPGEAPSLARPYPSPRPTPLSEGTYDLTPWRSQFLPVVRVTVPDGWRAWPGPSRIERLGAWGPDTVALFRGRSDWHVGLLVAQVTAVGQPGCTTRVTGDHDRASLVRALAGAPRLAVVSGPHGTVQDGRPTSRVRLRELGRPLACPDAVLFETPHGYIDGGGGGSTYDARVLDVDGESLLVWAGWTPGSPHSAVAALRHVVDTLVLRDRGHR